jgi:acyl carrier protein
MTEEIKNTLKEYILKEFMSGEDPEELTDTTPLESIIDSISGSKLVAFIEKSYGVSFQAHETNAQYFNNIQGIANLIVSKRG